MKYVAWIIIVFLAFLLQTRIIVFDTSPKLSFLLVYFAGIRYSSNKGILMGTLIGGIEDSLTSSIIGPHMLTKGFIGYFSSYLVSGSLLMWSPFLGVIAILFFSLLDSYSVHFIRGLFDSYSTSLPVMLSLTLRQAILVAPAGVVLKPRNVY